MRRERGRTDFVACVCGLPPRGYGFVNPQPLTATDGDHVDRHAPPRVADAVHRNLRRGGRTVGLEELGPQLVQGPARLVVGDAVRGLGQMAEIVRLAGDKITLLSGDDNLTLPVLSIGGKGVVSVVANIAPRDTSDMVDFWERGDVEKAKVFFYKLFPLCQAMFYETNPIPVKTSLALMGKIKDEMRLPLFPMAQSNLEKLKNALKDYGLL